MLVSSRKATQRQRTPAEYFAGDPALIGCWPLTENLQDMVPGGIVYGTTQLVTNGGFDSDTVWNKGAGWTIAAGVASVNAASGFYITNPNILTIGKLYKITYTITSYASGNLRIVCGTSDGSEGTGRVAVGTYTEILRCKGSNGSLGIRTIGAATTVASIDNVTAVEVTYLNETSSADLLSGYGTFDSWTGSFPNEIPNGFSAYGTHNANLYCTPSGGGFRLVSDGSATTGVNMANALTVGKAYRITGRCTAGSAQRLRIGSGSGTPGDEIWITGTGAFSAIISAYEITFYIYSFVGNTADITINDLVIRQIDIPIGGNHLVPADLLNGHGDFTIDVDPFFTSIDAGWTVNGGVAKFNSGAAANIYKSAIAIVGKAYEHSITISAVTGGGVKFLYSTATLSVAMTTPGTYKIILIQATDKLIGIQGVAGATATVDNWTVQEVYDGYLGPDGAVFNGISNCLQTKFPVDLSGTRQVTLIAEVKILNYDFTNTSALFELSPTTQVGIFNVFMAGSVANDPFRLITAGDQGNDQAQYYSPLTNLADKNKHFMVCTFDMLLAGNESNYYQDGSPMIPSARVSVNNFQFFKAFNLYIGGRAGSSLFTNIAVKNLVLLSRIPSSEEVFDYTAWQRDDRSPRPMSLFTGGPGQYQQLLRRRRS